MGKHFSGNNWNAADTFIHGGKTNSTRNVGHNTYLARRVDGSIALVYHHTAVVIYRQNGTQTLQTGGWRTVTTKRRLNAYSAANVHSSYDRKYPGWQMGWTGEHTPSRIQKCRTCKGQGGSVQRRQCHGAPGYSWGRDTRVCEGPQTLYRVEYNYDSTNTNWKEHVDSAYVQPCLHGVQFTGRHHLELCEHGNREAHEYGEVYTTECHRCKGVGMVEYGNKPIPAIWDGQPILIDEKGEVLDWHPAHIIAPTKAHYSPPGTPKSSLISSSGHSMDSEAQVVLENLLPAMREDVLCPCPCKLKASISSVIIHLNDSRSWSRESIADWLDTLDNNLRFPTKEMV